MPRKPSNTLTEAELRLMNVLWDRGESAVSDLVSAVSEEAALAYTSVLTTIRILEKKGYVEHRLEPRQDGRAARAFLYSAVVGRDEASRSEVRHVLSRFFANSREELLLSLLGDEDITAAELQRLKAAIAAAPDDATSPAPSRPAPRNAGLPAASISATRTREAR